MSCMFWHIYVRLIFRCQMCFGGYVSHVITTCIHIRTVFTHELFVGYVSHMFGGRYSQSHHVGWDFRELFQSSKLKARTALFTETWRKGRSSFELWALKQHSNMSPQVGLADYEVVSLCRVYRFTLTCMCHIYIVVIYVWHSYVCVTYVWQPVRSDTHMCVSHMTVIYMWHCHIYVTVIYMWHMSVIYMTLICLCHICMVTTT